MKVENDFESRIIDFLEKLRARQTKEIMTTLAPAMSHLTALAVAIGDIHRHTTAAGAAFTDLTDSLRERGVPEESIGKMLAEVRGAQEAFANEIGQAALEATLQHFNDALEVAEESLRN